MNETLNSADLNAILGSPELKSTAIEEFLDELATFSKLDSGPGVTRLALSKEDMEARDYLAQKMIEAGMEVTHHPFGVIGQYIGTDEKASPVAIMSHIDSVPNGGKYDGTYGVVSGIQAVKALNSNKITPERDIFVLAITGEESARFGRALFGSDGFYRGLSDEDLGAKRANDISIGDALQEFGFDLNDVKRPYFKDKFKAVLEIHASQSNALYESRHDVAIINAIAAPSRHYITIGEAIKPDTENVDADYLTISVHGKTGHSGATLMGSENRADGLLAMNDIIRSITLIKRRCNLQVAISATPIEIEGQAMNKIPGETSIALKVSGEDKAIFQEMINNFAKTRAEKEWPKYSSRLNRDSVTFTKIGETDAQKINFYKGDQILPVLELTSHIARYVYKSGLERKNDKTVATVTTVSLDGDKIQLGVDIRGIDAQSRNEAVEVALKRTRIRNLRNKLKLKIEALPGNEDPVTLDKDLVDLGMKRALELGLNPVMDNSKAGHDIQNAARAHHPASLVFIPSGNNGASHVPDEICDPDHCEKGARLLAAMMYELANTA